MKSILFICAIALVSLFLFYGCNNEDNLIDDRNDKPAATDSIPATDSVKISIVLNCDSLLLYVGDVDTLIATIKEGDKIVDYKVTWSIDSFQIAVVDSNGVVAALSTGSAMITVTYQDLGYTCKVVVTERPIIYEYVDLGLSVNWATCNVGATKPEEYGDYFAWGETLTKSTYDWSTYKWCEGSKTTMTKYCYRSDYGYNGFTDSMAILAPEDDVAHLKWGDSWRMPTIEELDELRFNCTWTWYSSGNSEFGGVAGYKVTSNQKGYTDRFIFLPAAGCRLEERLDYVGCGYYSSRTLGTGDPVFACGLGFSSESFSWYLGRSEGYSIRPVCPINVVESFALNYTELSLVEGATADLLKATIKGYVDKGIIIESDNKSVATVNSVGQVTALSIGTAIITATFLDKSISCIITVVDESEVEHECVDLGLSVKWATFNVGATKPEQSGFYYAWGETETKTDYNWLTYKWCNGSFNTLTKYNTNSDYGAVDNKSILDPEDDVAHVKWGGSWRMPTKAEQDELCENCTWTLYGSGNSEFCGVTGYKVTSNIEGYTDRFIFLPAAGCRDDWELGNVVGYCYYWSSSLYTSYTYLAHYILFPSDSMRWFDYGRLDGRSVRPVCP